MPTTQYEDRSTRPALGQLSRAVGVCLCLCLQISLPATAAAPPEFDEWLAGVRQEALERGISPETVAAALTDLEPEPVVLERDRNQPLFTQDFCDYIEKRLSETRVQRGKQMLAEHGQLLQTIERKFGVPPRYLVSLWGLESNFGESQGDYGVIRALATLAHDPRRPKTFRRQLFAALQILDEGHKDVAGMEGSWAGAMGQVQFMPTTFLAYAVDYDGDGRKDIWGSVPDALASAANYLSKSGWKQNESWGRPIRLPGELVGSKQLSQSRSVAEWGRLGVRRHDGGRLPRARLKGSIVLPAKRPSPAFLVYQNYRTILRWNRSDFFGLSVGTMADRITERGPLQTCSR